MNRPLLTDEIARLYEAQPHEDVTAYERHARRFSRIATAVALALVLITFAATVANIAFSSTRDQAGANNPAWTDK